LSSSPIHDVIIGSLFPHFSFVAVVSQRTNGGAGSSFSPARVRRHSSINSHTRWVRRPSSKGSTTPESGMRPRAAFWAHFSPRMHQIVRKILFLFSVPPACEDCLSQILTTLHFTVLAVLFGESIASEGVGEYMFVEGRVLTTGGEPIPGAIVETWEADGTGERRLDVSKSFRVTVYGHAFAIPFRIVRYAVRGTHHARVPWPAEDRRGGEVRVSRDRPRPICHS
jgi:hypothetical protein